MYYPQIISTKYFLQNRYLTVLLKPERDVKPCHVENKRFTKTSLVRKPKTLVENKKQNIFFTRTYAKHILEHCFGCFSAIVLFSISFLSHVGRRHRYETKVNTKTFCVIFGQTIVKNVYEIPAKKCL